MSLKNEIFHKIEQDHRFYLPTNYGLIVLVKEGDRGSVISSDHFAFPVGKLIRMNNNTVVKVNY